MCACVYVWCDAYTVYVCVVYVYMFMYVLCLGVCVWCAWCACMWFLCAYVYVCGG